MIGRLVDNTPASTRPEARVLGGYLYLLDRGVGWVMLICLADFPRVVLPLGGKRDKACQFGGAKSHPLCMPIWRLAGNPPSHANLSVPYCRRLVVVSKEKRPTEASHARPPARPPWRVGHTVENADGDTLRAGHLQMCFVFASFFYLGPGAPGICTGQ